MNEQSLLKTKLEVSDYKVLPTLFDWQMISGKCSAETPKQWPLKHQKYISSWRISKVKNSSVILYPAASSARFHGDKVSGNGNRLPNLDISTHIYLLCLHIISLSHLHFLSILQKHLSLSYISHSSLPFSFSLSFHLSHTQTLSLSPSLRPYLSLQKVSESAGFKAH